MHAASSLQAPLPPRLLVGSAVITPLRSGCAPLSDLNEADIKALKEIRPGSEMLFHAHSYSLEAAAAQKNPHSDQQMCIHLRAHW